MPPGMNLIFDADDTLWECNVLFEQAIEEFIDYVAHPELSRARIRAELTEIERANSAATDTAPGSSNAASAIAWPGCGPAPRPATTTGPSCTGCAPASSKARSCCWRACWRPCTPCAGGTPSTC